MEKNEEAWEDSKYVCYAVFVICSEQINTNFLRHTYSYNQATQIEKKEFHFNKSYKIHAELKI